MSEVDPQISARVRAVSAAASVVAALLGVAGLVGWFCDVEALRLLIPGMTAMHVNAALALTVLGLSLWGVRDLELPRRGLRQWLPRAGAGLVVFLCALTLAQYFFGCDWGVDRMLLRGPPSTSLTAPPGPMAPNTAVSFLFLSLALWVLDRPSQTGRWPAQWLVLTALVIGALALLGRLHHAVALYEVAPRLGMAPNTALGVVLLAVAVLCARPERGVMRHLVRPGHAGMIIRRLALAGIVLSLACDGLAELGEALGWYEASVRDAARALLVLGVFLGLLLTTARSLSQAEARREEAEAELRQQLGGLETMVESRLQALRAAEEKYRSILENAVEGIFQTAPDGQLITANPALARMLGYDSPEELLRCLPTVAVKSYVEPRRREEYKRLMAREGQVTGFEYQVYRRDGTIIWFSESGRTVRDGTGQLLYYEGMIEDITERKRAEAERERMIAELREALANVKTLSGLLPICSGCKKIRDDQGYWSHLESYLQQHSGATFTHGLCPQCIEKYFPGVSTEDSQTPPVQSSSAKPRPSVEDRP